MHKLDEIGITSKKSDDISNWVRRKRTNIGSNDFLMKSSKEGQNRNYYHGYFTNFVNSDIEEVPLDISVKLAALELPTNEMNKSQYQNMKSVFFDCLHFSTLTVTTFGFADVSRLHGMLN